MSGAVASGMFYSEPKSEPEPYTITDQKSRPGIFFSWVGFRLQLPPLYKSSPNSGDKVDQIPGKSVPYVILRSRSVFSPLRDPLINLFGEASLLVAP